MSTSTPPLDIVAVAPYLPASAVRMTDQGVVVTVGWSDHVVPLGAIVLPVVPADGGYCYWDGETRCQPDQVVGFGGLQCFDGSDEAIRRHELVLGRTRPPTAHVQILLLAYDVGDALFRAWRNKQLAARLAEPLRSTAPEKDAAAGDIHSRQDFIATVARLGVGHCNPASASAAVVSYPRRPRSMQDEIGGLIWWPTDA